MGFSSSKVNLSQSVSSLFITKKIFSILTEKKKLKLISYNKNYQNKLKIEINDFKRVSGRHIIGEKNGQEKNMIMRIDYFLKENM